MIVGIVNMFAESSPVYLVNEPKAAPKLLAKVPVNELPNFLAEFVHTYKDKSVTLYGVQKYTQQIADSLIETAQTNYNLNNIEVELKSV